MRIGFTAPLFSHHASFGGGASAVLSSIVARREDDVLVNGADPVVSRGAPRPTPPPITFQKAPTQTKVLSSEHVSYRRYIRTYVILSI